MVFFGHHFEVRRVLSPRRISGLQGVSGGSIRRNRVKVGRPKAVGRKGGGNKAGRRVPLLKGGTDRGLLKNLKILVAILAQSGTQAQPR